MSPWTKITASAALFLALASVSKASWTKPPDQPIKTPAGDIVVTKIEYSHALGVIVAHFRIVNMTNVTWSELNVRLIGSDKNGDVALRSAVWDPNPANIQCIELAPGESCDFRVSKSAKADNKSFALTFAFAGGTYAAKYRFALELPEQRDALEYSRDSLVWSFIPVPNGIGFRLANNSPSSVSVDLDKSSIVDAGSMAHRVASGDVRVINAMSAHPPLVVPASSEIRDLIVPVDGMILLPDCPTCRAFTGKTITLLIHVEQDGAPKDYTFKFKVTSVE